MTQMTGALHRLNEAAEYIRARSQIRPRLGIVLGSGLGHLISSFKVEMSLPFQDIPHLAPPTVEGHPGKLVLGHHGDVPVVAMQGRVHFYEGHSMEKVVFPIRLLKFLGIDSLLLTNAAGGILSGMQPGDLMVIRDQINLTGQNPLIGPNLKEFGPRFPDMTTVYHPHFSDLLSQILNEQNLRYFEGVYVGVSGPSYETPAEIRFFQTIGGGAVGMSTVAEAIAARHLGLRVAGLSCITNVAAGLKDSKLLDHKDVKDVANQAEVALTQVISKFIQKASAVPESI